MRSRYLVLIFSCMGPAAQSSYAGQIVTPRINEHVVNVTFDSPVDREIAVGKILELTKEKSSYIRFVWTDEAFSYAAQALRHTLILKDIPADRIAMSHVNGGYQGQDDATGLRIYVQNIVLRLPECHYATQNYRFRIAEEQGCAVNNNRGVSLVNPYKYYF